MLNEIPAIVAYISRPCWNASHILLSLATKDNSLGSCCSLVTCSLNTSHVTMSVGLSLKHESLLPFPMFLGVSI